jgi:hypothetical protein
LWILSQRNRPLFSGCGLCSGNGRRGGIDYESCTVVFTACSIDTHCELV